MNCAKKARNQLLDRYRDDIGVAVAHCGRDQTGREKKSGGRDRVRTCDPLLAKQVLSQLSYTPIL